MSVLTYIRSTLVSFSTKQLQYSIFSLLLLMCWFTQAQSITELEYYFGSDPGIGNATMVTATANSGELTQSLSIPLTGLQEGFHTLTLRAKDDAGTWGLFDRNVFFISEDLAGSNPISNLAAAEYWFDGDPGPGNGTALAITGNPSETTESFVIPLGTLNGGFHTLGLRTQNLDGTWSLFDRNVFFVSEDLAGSNPISNLAAAEYWFDGDPGPGNGTAIAITGNPSETTESFVIPLGTLNKGFHTLGMRTQNLDGTWSLFDRKVFYIDKAEMAIEISPLTDMEFLYDAELGFGTGTAVAITPTGNPDEYLVEIPTNLVTCDIHDVSLSIKNADGNYSLYRIITDVDVFDNLPPTIVVFPNITAVLDANGQASITIADVNNGTFDDCELVSVVLNQTQFDYTCANLGANTVTVTATDAEAKVSTLDVTITVVDNINPVAITQNITVQLDANGNATFTADDVDNNSTDNCAITTKALDITSFTCANLGANTVILTVTDQSGNANNTTATVTVEDNIDPVAIAQNITVQLDTNGNATFTAEDVDNNSTDNCSITSKSLDFTSFNCTNLGANTVTFTVTDQSGNTNNTTATVTVVDNINPVAITQNITVQLDASGNVNIMADDIDNASTDNCAITTKALDITSFTCANLGTNTVTLTVTDQSGNTDTANATVTVQDGIVPVAIAQNITVQLDATGNVSIVANDIDNVSTDNCSITSKSLDFTSFNCTNLGANTVTLTVTDQSGNTNSTTATVTVVDDIAPTVVTQNVTVQLDANGTTSITINDIENGSTDNCTITTKSLDITSFNCTNLGANSVTLTVTDQSGNTNSTTATVTVQDNINPVAITQNITVQLDASGNATINAAQIENGSTDNCTISSSTLDVTSFTCSNLGANTVTLTVTDQSGNINSTTVTVTVVDTIDPTVIGQDISIDIAGNPSVIITANDVDNGSFDNCNFSLSVDVDTFTSIGIFDVILTGIDNFGNISSVSVLITVTDSTFGVEENELLSKQIILFPVPTKGSLNISTNLIIDAINIFDINGRKILQIDNPNRVIDVSNLSSGVYFLRFNVENTLVTKRIIRQ